jgi:hypothetical protein
MLQAGAVPDEDQEFPGIVMHCQVLRCAGTPDSEIAQHGFLARKGILSGHPIPFFALRGYGAGYLLPNRRSKGLRRFPVEFFFLSLAFDGKFGCQVFPR